MNNKFLVIFTILIMLIFVCGISGCPQITFPWQRDRSIITTGRGVVAQFRTGEPPLEGIYASENPNFRVAIDLLNYMQTEVGVKACISDTPSYSHFGGIPSECDKRSDPDPIPAAEKVDSKFYPGRAIMEFDEFNYNLNVEKGMTTNIIVSLDTEYRLRLTPQICIKKTGTEIAGVGCEDTSTLSGAIIGEDSLTAPVTVTRIEKQIWPLGGDSYNVHLRIYLDDLGYGKIYREDVKDKTRQILEAPKVKLIGGDWFTCMPGKIYLEEGEEKAMTCDLRVDLEPGEAVRRNPVSIEFDYVYRILASTGEIPIIVPRGVERKEDGGLGEDYWEEPREPWEAEEAYV